MISVDLLFLKDILRGSPWSERMKCVLEVDTLVEAYCDLVERAPRRRRPYLSKTRSGVTSSGATSNRGEEHLAVALFNLGKVALPDGPDLTLVDYQFPLKAVRADAGIGKVDLLGVTHDGVITIVELKVASSREDCRVGLVEALTYAAVIEANVETIARELECLLGRPIRRDRPDIILAAPSAFWAAATGPSLINLERLLPGLASALGIGIDLFCIEDAGVSFGLMGARPALIGQPFLAPLRAQAALGTPVVEKSCELALHQPV